MQLHKPVLSNSRYRTLILPPRGSKFDGHGDNDVGGGTSTCSSETIAPASQEMIRGLYQSPSKHNVRQMEVEYRTADKLTTQIVAFVSWFVCCLPTCYLSQPQSRPRRCRRVATTEVGGAGRLANLILLINCALGNSFYITYISAPGLYVI